MNYITIMAELIHLSMCSLVKITMCALQCTWLCIFLKKENPRSRALLHKIRQTGRRREERTLFFFFLITRVKLEAAVADSAQQTGTVSTNRMFESLTLENPSSGLKKLQKRHISNTFNAQKASCMLKF